MTTSLSGWFWVPNIWHLQNFCEPRALPG